MRDFEEIAVAPSIIKEDAPTKPARDEEIAVAPSIIKEDAPTKLPLQS